MLKKKANKCIYNSYTKTVFLFHLIAFLQILKLLIICYKDERRWADVSYYDNIEYMC